MTVDRTFRKSCKVIGRYELPLMQRITKYFMKMGFAVVTHVRFNFAWSHIYSDIDVLIFKDDLIYVIEVKSKRDNFSKAFAQLDKIKDFVDFMYVACEKAPRKWGYEEIGLLIVDDVSIKEINKPAKIETNHRIRSIQMCQRKCLSRLVKRQELAKNQDCLSKEQLSNIIHHNLDSHSIRYYLKEIATCGIDCENNCPLLR